MFSVSKVLSPFRRLLKDKRGNVLIIMGFALIPVTMAAGIAVDYTRAGRLKTKLDAAADAAVLSAVSEAASSANDKTVCERAAALFNSQASAITNIGYSISTSITLSVGSTVEPNNVTYNGATNSCSNPIAGASSAASRVVSLSYSVESNNYFGSLLNKASIPVSGRAGSEVSIAPDVDFYVALDTSPSMALPVTTQGISDMVAATTTAGTPTGCTFACHSNKIGIYTSGSLGETPQDNVKYGLIKESPARHGKFSGQDITYVDTTNAFTFDASTGRKVCYDRGNNYGNTSSSGCANYKVDLNVYNSDGSLADTYWYARNKGITLRIDEMRRATSDLVTTALAEAEKNEATYRAAIYGFDYEQNFRQIQSLVKIAEKSTAGTYAATQAAGIAFQAKAMSNQIDIAMIDDKSGNGCPATNCSGNTYRFTSFKGLLDGVQGAGYLPATSGRGTRAVGDTPQAFLFIITDGMSDEKASPVSGLWSQGDDRTRSEITGSGTGNHLSKCSAIKARGVQIAILYTEYTAASIASDEVGQRTWVENRIPYVEPALRNCASPGYLLKVSSNGDISGALQALFRKAVSKPRLVQ